MTRDRVTVATIRKVLESAASLQALVQHQVESVRNRMVSEGVGDKVQEVYIHAVEVSLDGGFKRVEQYSESPIEKLFLNSLLVHFAASGDPTGIVVQSPSSDVRRDIDESRAMFCQMNDLNGRDFERLLNSAVASGELGPGAANEYERKHRSWIGLGYAYSIHIILQPTVAACAETQGKTLRPDLVVWAPGIPSLNVVVECDGYQFHGNKDSFTADRQRDRTLQRIGFEVQRFSGSEIFNHPVECAGELYSTLAEIRASHRFANSYLRR